VRAIVDISDLAPGGEGVARAEDGRAVFVPFTAPGDRVTVELSASDLRGATPPRAALHAPLVELLHPGPARVAPPCRHFGPLAAGEDERGCGGCEWLHLGYEAQLAAKERALAETLRRIGKLEPGSYCAPPVLPSPSPLRYRSRAKFHLDRGTGRLVFFRRRSHEPVQLRECHLLEPELDALREAAGPALVAARLDAREVTLEWSRHERRGSAHLRLAALGGSTAARAEALLAAVPALSGLVLTADGASSAVVERPVLRHERRPGARAAGLARSRPDVFQQANRGANALLVDAALALLRPDGEDVLELFCGAGNFTGPLAARARTVAAVEGQGPALDLARADLAEPAGGGAARNVRFFAGDALALARAFARESGPGARRFGAALLDPPREGARGVGAALRDLGVPRAVYVSCDPATFARDLRACGEAGYRVETVQAVDMFPQTHHVEAIALLVKS
jgi:23S rRNA (uracil1939-C5)-methyltransferase